MARTPLIAGNWKMNGLAAQLSEIGAVGEAVADGRTAGADLLLCVPATILSAAAGRAVPGLMIGAQDCHPEASGAHTGDMSAEMLADAGASAVIVGHSERRTDHRESDETVRAKLGAAHRAKLHAVVCIGETQAERDAGRTLGVLGAQLAGSLADDCTGENTTVAYEPVWAIGTGRTPTVADVAEVHDFLRAELAERFGAEAAERFRLLYGGSVKPDNAAELMAVGNVDGALVGGASLKSADFLRIVEGAVAAKGRSGGLE